MRALRKVYKGTGKAKRPGSAPSGTRFGPGAPIASATDVIALESLDLDIGAGEFFGLLGPNGAGKTTAIGILTTRVRPTSGEAIVGGADVVENSVRVRQVIGVVPQRPNLDFSLTVREILTFHGAYFGLPAAEPGAPAASSSPSTIAGYGYSCDARQTQTLPDTITGAI